MPLLCLLVYCKVSYLNYSLIILDFRCSKCFFNTILYFYTACYKTYSGATKDRIKCKLYLFPSQILLYPLCRNEGFGRIRGCRPKKCFSLGQAFQHFLKVQINWCEVTLERRIAKSRFGVRGRIIDRLGGTCQVYEFGANHDCVWSYGFFSDYDGF